MNIIEKIKNIVIKYRDTDNNDFNLSILLSFFVLLIVWIFIGTFKFVIDEDFIINNYIVDASLFYNNTGKNLQYISVLLGFPILFLIFFSLISKDKISKIKKFKYTHLLLKICILLLSFCCVMNLCTSILFGIIVSMFLVLTYIIIDRYRLERLKLIKDEKMLKIVIIVISILTSLLYIDTTYQSSFFLMHHVTAYYYPIHKVLNGLTPYIDFNSLYGGYSYIFAFILSFFNEKIQLLVFSIMTSLLVFVSLVLTYKFLNKTIKNKTIVLFTFLSILFCNVFYIYFTENSTYLQFFPHRYLFIIIMLNYILLYLDEKKIKNIITGYLICSIAMFWNFESGAILLISWSMLLFYDIVYNKRYRQIFLVLLFSVLSFILYLFIIEIIIFVRVGCFSDIKDILFSVLFFSNSGFLSLKLNLLDEPWIITIVFYLFYLGKSIIFLIKKNNNQKDNMLNFYLSILGLGLFVYYLERPILLRFLLICFPFLMLIAKNNKKILNYVFIVELSCSVLCIIGLVYSIFIKTTSGVSKSLFYTYEWLQKFSNDIGKDNFEMFINCDIIYYELLEKKDYKKTPSYLDLFTKDDLNNVIRYIGDSDKSIVVSWDLYVKYSNYFLNNDNIIKKYYLYYKYDKSQYDNYIFFIKKDDINKISNLEEYGNVDDLKLLY